MILKKIYTPIRKDYSCINSGDSAIRKLTIGTNTVGWFLYLLTLPAHNMTEISSNFVKEAKKNGVQYIVKLSVMGADEEPGLVIGRLHRQAEKIIEDSGIS